MIVKMLLCVALVAAFMFLCVADSQAQYVGNTCPVPSVIAVAPVAPVQAQAAACERPTLREARPLRRVLTAPGRLLGRRIFHDRIANGHGFD